MRAVAQRVASARVCVDGAEVGAIDRGLLVYLGVGREDAAADVTLIADKLAGLRVFEDDAGRMSLDLPAVRGAVLLVSQFTLYGDVRRGRRPSFDAAMEPVAAEALYRDVARRLTELGIVVETGVFRATMSVESVNDGPVTILIDSKRGF